MILVDTGPWAALCDRRDSHHARAVKQLETLASGGLPPLLGIESNGFYVKNPLAPYIDPPLPWPGGTGTAADRAAALARTFHRAHAIDWCNAFHAGSSLDVDALRTRAETLHDDPSASADEQTAACAVCKEFASRHLRVGTDAADYNHAREPLCFTAALLHDIAETGIRFKDLNTKQSSLEDIFVNLVREQS